MPAAADVIYEPSNDFLYDHYSECRGVERWYTAASPDDELTVYESPESAKAAARVPNGSRIYIYSSYTDRSGNDWGLCEGNGPYWSGWVPMSYLEEPYDRTAFEKEFASKIRGESGDVKIPEAVQTIGMGAFLQCDRLVHVTIPESVTSIEYLAFQNCRRLQRLTVMNGDCEINEDVSTMCDPAQTEIIGRRDSKAERYAKRFGYKFTDYNDAYGGPDAPVNPFVDVERGEYCYAPVLWAVYHSPQITKGTDAAHFSPNAACTRGQVVTFLWRAAGCPKPAGTDNPFTDVRPGDYFYKAVLWAVEKGVTRGTSDTLFSPNDGCTRGQVVTFLWRAAGSPVPSGAGTAFADVKPGAFYEKAVAWAVEKGITRGMTETTFAPNAACTRGQVVTFLYRSDK